MKNKILIIFLAFFTFMVGCQDLDVENPNNPASEDVLSDGANLRSLGGSVIQNWYLTNMGYYETPAFMMGTAADAATASWGNFGLRDMSWEPRNAWNNDPAYGNSAYTEDWYKGMYAILSQSNDVLKGMQTEGIEIGEDNADKEMVKAVTKLGQGVALGYIGLVFDKGFIVKEDDDLTEEFELKPYDQVIDAALASIDEAIEIANNNTFTIPEAWLNSPVALDNVKFAELANFMAAKILMSSARTGTENENNDWSKILSYAQNGLTYDLTITADYSYGSWSSMYIYYGSNPGWGRVDMRIVDMLDTENDIPPVWKTEWQGDYTKIPNEGLAEGPDNRLNTDFTYNTSVPFRPERGFYHFSTYRYSRFDPIRNNGWPGQGPFDWYRKAENDYMIAEAMIRANNNVSGAINVLNNSARVTRGGAAMQVPSGASAQEVLDIIFYERHIELFSNNMGIQYFDMRRFDQLQKGTPLHWPIPGAELETLQLPNYSFGGADNAGQEGTADAGWKEAWESGK
jgi:hypothetical protein